MSNTVRTNGHIALVVALAWLLATPARSEMEPRVRQPQIGTLYPISSTGVVTGTVSRHARSQGVTSVALTLVAPGIVISDNRPTDPFTGQFSAQVPEGWCRNAPCTITATAMDGSDDVELNASPQQFREALPPILQPPPSLDLTNRCIGSPDPGGENAFIAEEPCASARSWTLALQSERTLGDSCSGPPSQSLPINSPEGPAQFRWLPMRAYVEGDPSTAYLRLDTVANPHPCGEKLYTWFALMDHIVHGGGPLPAPTSLQQQVTLRYTDLVLAGVHRISLGIGVFWDGMFHMVDIDVAAPGWSKGIGPVGDVVNIIERDAFTYVHLDGSKYGLILPRGETITFTVNWTYILHLLIWRGILPEPSGGLTKAATGSVAVGMEVYNATPGNAVRSELWISGWKVTETTIGPGPSG